MSTAAAIDATKLEHFAELKAQKDLLEENLKQVNNDMRILESEILEQFADTDTSKITNAIGTFYVHTQTWASLRQPEEQLDGGTLEEIRQAQLELIKKYQPEIVKEQINSQTLSSWVRELTEGGLNPLPEDLAEVIKTTDKVSLRLTGRKAKS